MTQTFKSLIYTPLVKFLKKVIQQTHLVLICSSGTHSASEFKTYLKFWESKYSNKILGAKWDDR